MEFKLVSNFSPSGDQPNAISNLTANFAKGTNFQVLLGVTGSGKTYTVANLIEKLQLPTLIISHNKTLAGQLYSEFKEFFPNNAVEYFVSYYDYYQPESYIPSTDTYIEKEADINKLIESLRLKATASLMSRKDVIVVSSVSCIYNLGSPLEFTTYSLNVKRGISTHKEILERLVEIFYQNSKIDFEKGNFRQIGSVIDIWPAYTEYPIRLEFSEEILQKIYLFNPITGEETESFNNFVIFPAKHYVSPNLQNEEILNQIRQDLTSQVQHLKSSGKPLEAYRLEQKTNNDLEMIKEIGYCNGIENYSRYFDKRNPGEPPFTLIDFFGKEFLLIIDESHMTIPQIGGMYNGDRSRKETLINYGFRLPSALDNRPLNFAEFESKIKKVIFTSATPDTWEIAKSNNTVIEQLVRPTGIPEPEILIKPTNNQIPDLIERIKERVSKNERVLVTTLTKKISEELSDYLQNKTDIKTAYLHSDIETLERTEILTKLRKGEFSVLIGVNLLREGLDLPEVSLVAILDADKEGFLRSKTALIQTMGRTARHVNGQVVLYADTITKSIQGAKEEVDRRRKYQLEYNKKMGITPRSVKSNIKPLIIEREIKTTDENIDSNFEDFEFRTFAKAKQNKIIKNLEKIMKNYAENLQFEEACVIRDRLLNLKKIYK